MYEKIYTGFILVTLFLLFLKFIDQYYDEKEKQKQKEKHQQDNKKEDTYHQVGLSIDDDDENEEYI